jgi:hypothetical protein
MSAQTEPLDLQAIRLAAVTAAPILERLRGGGTLSPEDAQAFDQAVAGLFQVLERVEGFQQELKETQDDRAAAYLVEAQCWDLLGQAKPYVDGTAADPTEYERRQLASDIDRQLEHDPPDRGWALWGELRTARPVVDAARPVPDLLGEGHFSASEIDLVKTRLISALAVHDEVLKAGEAR